MIICHLNYNAFSTLLCLWNFFQTRDMELFQHIHKMSQELIDCQRKILSGTLPVDELKELKQMITTRIDMGNR